MNLRYSFLIFAFISIPTIVSQAQPSITSFNPTSGPVGTSVTITGTGFSATPANNIVFFGATRANVTLASPTQLTVTVPVGATYQPLTIMVNGLIAYSRIPFSTTYSGWTGIIDASSFAPRVSISTGYGWNFVASGDLDGDGKSDLVIANNYNEINAVSVLRNNGAPGTINYDSKIGFPTGTRPFYVAIGDLDGDGKPDLAVVNYEANTVSVLRNTGIPGSINFEPKQDFSTGTNPSSIAIGDLDGDGKQDLAVVSSTSANVSVFRNISTGIGNISYAPYVNVATGNVPNSVSIGDLDGDGRLDLAVANESNSVSALRNNGTPGSISFEAKVDFPTGFNTRSIVIGDLDGDSKPDLAVGIDFHVSVLHNTGMPGIINYADKINFPTTSSPYSIAIGDLDGDGKQDLSMTYNTYSEKKIVSILRNASTGAGDINYNPKIDLVLDTESKFVAISDLDGDSKADLTLLSFKNGIEASDLSILRHQSLPGQVISFNPLPNKFFGDPTFSLAATSSSGLPITYTSSNPAVATVSGNTVTIVSTGSTTITASQPGNTFFSPAVSISHPLVINSPLAISDFYSINGPVGSSVIINGTGFSSTPANNIVFFGATRAAVTLATSTQLTVTVPVGATYHPLTVLVNGLVAYTKVPFSTSYSGWGVVNASSFNPKVDISTNTSPISVAIGDLDGDGKSDLAVANRNNNTVSILRNTGASGSISYATRIDFPTGTNPSSVAIGDLDGDGKLDLAVTNFGNNNVSILRNTGTPGSISFAPKQDFSTGTNPISVAIGDLDGDGKPDLAVANNAANTASVLRNIGILGSINYAAKIDLPAGTNPSFVAMGDLNGDGKPDLAVTNFGNNNVSVLRNNGTTSVISFEVKADFATGTNPTSVTIGDLNSDGRADIAVTNISANTVSVLRNTGTLGAISYAAKVDFPTGANPTSIAIGDLDGNGISDMAVTNYGQNFVSVFRNAGPTTNISFATQVGFPTGNNPYGIAIGDLNGDRRADMVITNFSDNTVSILKHESLNFQTITFNALPNKFVGDTPFMLTATSTSGLPITYTSSNPSVGTISGNMLTIIAAGSTTITASQPGNATYAAASNVERTLVVSGLPPIISNFTPTSGPVGTVVTITGTGFSSIAANNIVFFGATRATVTLASTTQLTVTVPNGATYQPMTVMVNGLIAYSKIPFSTTYSGWGFVDASSFMPRIDLPISNGYAPTMSDLNGDGKIDLVLKSNSNGASVLLNTGTPGLISYGPIMNFPTGGLVYANAAGDLNGDGKIDLAATKNNSTVVSILRNTGASGTLTFANKVDLTTGADARGVALGDLDGDGKVDVAVANIWDPSVSVFRNTRTSESISYALKRDFSVSFHLHEITIGDLDGDGKPDLVVTNGPLSVLRNISTPGTINYATEQVIFTGGSSNSIALGDLDGDGKADLVVTDFTGNKVSILRNTGTPGSISFAPKQDFFTGTNPSSVAIGDLDGDGKPDLAVTNSVSNTISILRNTGTPGSISYAPKVDFNTGTNPSSVTIGDLDGDGKSDIAFSSGSSVSILRHSGANQTITFPPLPSTCISSSLNLVATSSSGLPVTYTSSNPSIASITGNILTAHTSGTVTITATQAGNGTFSPASATQNLTVNPLPVATISASGVTTICAGGSVTLTASSGSSYLWSTGATSQSINVSSTGNYSVTITNTNNCSALSIPTIVTVNPSASITVSPASPSICAGGSVVLSASGATSYTWSPATGLSATTGSTVTATPSTTTTYTVTGPGSNGCVGSRTVTVTVNPLPTLSFNPTNPAICSGQSVSITASGASTYSWSPSTGLSATTGATVTASPTANRTYTVTGTSASGCVGNSAVTVTVKPLPTINVSPTAPSICLGSSVSLTASGGVSYSWSPSTGLSSTTGATVTANPVSSTTYTITGTGSNACVNTRTVTVSVQVLAGTIFQTNGLCPGVGTDLYISQGTNVQWSTGSTGLVTSINNPGTYSVTYNFNGCAYAASIFVDYEPNCSGGGGGCPDPYNPNCPCTVGPCARQKIEKEKEALDFGIYPNPADAFITLQLPQPATKDETVIMTDQMGRTVNEYILRSGEQALKIPTEQAAGGLYLLQIGTGEAIIRKKVMITHQK